MVDTVKNENKKGLIYVNEGKYVSYQIWYFELEYFTKYFPQINNEDDYGLAIKSFKSERDFISAEEFVYNMVNLSDGGFSNLIVRSAEEMHSDYGRCTWNTLTSPSESDKIIDGCVSTISRITIPTDGVRAERLKPRPDWRSVPEACPNVYSKVAFVTWNSSTSTTNNSIAKLTYPDGTTKILEHTVYGMGGNNVTLIDTIDGDIQIEITLNGHNTMNFIINKDTINGLSDVYQPTNPL